MCVNHPGPQKRRRRVICTSRLLQVECDKRTDRAKRGATIEQVKYPTGTIALYGPDDKTTTKIAAAVIVSENAEPVLERSMGTDMTTNPKVQQKLQEFFRRYGVESVAMSQGNMGCPHEEGEDFPMGEVCPFCPFWRGKQGSNRRERGDVRWRKQSRQAKFTS